MAARRNIIVNAASVSAVLANHESVSDEKVQEATDDPIEQARLIAGINNALIEIQDHERSADVLSSPPSAIASQLQSFLAAKANEEGKAKSRDLPGGGEEAKFDSNDWLGWAKSFFSWVGGLTKAGWVKAPTEPDAMPDNARMALFADWGTGLYGAPAISYCIGADASSFTHVIHLGDIYYSGTEREIDDIQTPFWPEVKAATNLACNANHEMYSGGHGYFKKTLSMFGQKASYFALENRSWLVVGLDTAYDDHSLNSEQLGWLAMMLKDPKRSNKKLVLLSHHQPFSLLENQGPNVIGFLRLLLDTGRIHAWYWGHEHRCVVYDPHPSWKLKGRCIGFGGYPYFRDTEELKARNGTAETGANGSTWYRMPGMNLSADQSRVPGGLKIPSSLVLDGQNPYLGDVAHQYGPHGYLTLEFEADRLFETFYIPSEPGPTPVEVMVRREV
jgi:hypothetical protein